MASFYKLMGVDGFNFDHDRRFVTSWLLPPIVLASLRGLFSVYGFATTLANWSWDGTHNHTATIRHDFSYFTSLSWWGLAFYMLVASIHTFVYAVKGRYWLDGWPRPLQALHSLFYTTIITFPFLVTLVFWVILWNPSLEKETIDLFSDVSQHGFNSMFALCEIVLPATNPPPWLHLPFLLVILLLYLALAYITYATEGFYTYSFLNPAKNGRGIVAAYAFGILVAIVLVFLIVWCLVWVRRRFTGLGKRSKRDYVSGAGHAHEHSDPEMIHATLK